MAQESFKPFPTDQGSNSGGTCGPGGCDSVNEDIYYLFRGMLNVAPPVWMTDYEAALKAAKEADARVMAFFTAMNCGHCQTLKTNVFATQQFYLWVLLKNGGRPLILLKHEIPDYREPDDLCKKYTDGPNFGFPQTLGLNADGSERGRKVGDNGFLERVRDFPIQ